MNEERDMVDVFKTRILEGLDKLDGLEPGSKESQVQCENVVALTKGLNDLIRTNNDDALKSDQQDIDRELNQKRIEIEKEKLELDKKVAEEDLKSKKSGESIEKKKFWLAVAGVAIPVVMTIGKAIYLRKVRVQDMIYEEQGGFRTLLSKRDIELEKKFIEGLGRKVN